MYTCAKTGVYGGGYIYNQIQPTPDTKKFKNVNHLHEYIQSIKSHPNIDFSVEQESISTQDLLNGLRIKRKLGEGGFGTAFLANFELFGPCVVKLYTKMIHPYNALRIDSTTGLIQVHGENLERHKKEIEIVFTQEVHNLHKVLTPEKLGLSSFFDKSKMNTLSKQQYNKLREEMKKYKGHSGHEFIHHFIHYDPTIFCIISEPCEGDVLSLIDTPHGLQKTHEKQTFLVQVGLAVHYMLFVAKVAHTDIKPPNILWKLNGNGEYIFKVSDFGYLDDIERLPTSNTYLLTTSRYIPDLVLQQIKQSRRQKSTFNFDTPKIMLFTFLTTCLEVLTPQMFLSNYVSLYSYKLYWSIMHSSNNQNALQWLKLLDSNYTFDFIDLLFSFMKHFENINFWTFHQESNRQCIATFNDFIKKILSTLTNHPYNIQ